MSVTRPPVGDEFSVTTSITAKPACLDRIPQGKRSPLGESWAQASRSTPGGRGWCSLAKAQASKAA